jgi:EmrB/QacA subfamily drug resistance transporter
MDLKQQEHHTNPWVVLVLICMAQFMVVLDATVTNVALPSIQKDLGLSEANLQWIINAYTLVFGGFLLLGGRLGDLLGRKRLFLIGLVIFTFASLMNGLANSEGMLIGFRALQGLGAALISPAALSIISTTFEEGAERAKALAVWAAIAIGGAAFGLILGGALTQWFSWPWIFFVNVPVGIVVFFLSMRLVPESKDEHAPAHYDIAGAVTVTGGLMSLVYAIVHAETGGWTSSTTIGFFVLSAILLASFVVIESRSSAPLVRLSIFKIRSLTTANITMFLAMSAMFAMFFFNTLYVQRVLGYGPLEAGFAFLPFTAGIMVSAGLASAFAPKIGVRPVAAVGMLLSAGGLLLLTQLPVGGSYVSDVLPGMILTSLGMGAVFMPLTLVATTGLDNSDQGLASGLFNTSQQIGGALGLAVLSTVAAGRTKAAASSGASQAAALVHGFHWAYAGAAVIVLAALVVMLVLLRAKDVARIEAEARAGSTEPVFANS